MVYFIQHTNKNKYIKIGWTYRNPMFRLKQIQVGCSHPLELLGVMECKSGIEHALHDLFERYKIAGEWFEPADEILEFIKDNTLTYDEYKLYYTKLKLSRALTQMRKIRIR